jgi:hypothetical protein
LISTSFVLSLVSFFDGVSEHDTVRYHPKKYYNYNQIKDQYRELQQEHNKVVNKRDHDKERLIKALKEVSQREQVIRELQGRNVFDRIFNRIPDHIQLPESKPSDD